MLCIEIKATRPIIKVLKKLANWVVKKSLSMKYKFFIGVDVSKHTLDVAILESSTNSTEHLQVSNNDDGLADLYAKLNTYSGFNTDQVLFCIEPTGLYSYPLLQYLSKFNIDVWVENAVQIKRSIGLQRGKSDKVDAIRIAQYAFKNHENARLWRPVREVVNKLKHLAALRERLVNTKKMLLVPVEELKKMGDKSTAALLEKSMKKSVTGIENDIIAIEKQMKDIIDNDSQLSKLFNLVTSVVGIGFVTAVNLIIHTNEFTTLKDVRKLACYCGIAPFEYSSGISIKGRKRVHPMANKKLKTNLHMASLSGVRLDSALKAYYERKVAEGKSKLSVLNAVKNKLLARVIAVVNRGTPYVKNNYTNHLVLS